MKSLLLTLLSCLFTACVSVPPSQQAITPIRNISNLIDIVGNSNKPFIGHPKPNNYSICHGHTCNEFAFVSLLRSEWQTITVLFSPPAHDSEHERKLIKQAIALLETFSGQQTDTNMDQAENYTVHGLKGQLDCIDEATNSTVYLRMLQNADLLRFHKQAYRTSRGGLIAPHTTATIIDTESNIHYAVDAWFGNNGEPPAIVPLKLWKSGWKSKKD